jgi:hypothetical protein
MMPLRSVMWGLLSLCLLTACEPGNSLESFKGRQLRASLLPAGNTDDRTKITFKAELILKEPESGCLQLHPDVKATLDGLPLVVTPGSAATRDGPCGGLNPTFINPVDVSLFLGEPRNAVLDIWEGDDHITAEFINLFARHTFVQPSPTPTVKPGEEIFLAWDPPTDDLSQVGAASLDNLGVVPVRPEPGGVRLTIPESLPEGTVQVTTQASHIPTARCEGVAECAATSQLFLPRAVQVRVQN